MEKDKWGKWAKWGKGYIWVIHVLLFGVIRLLGLLDNVFMGIFAIYGVIWFYVWFYMYYQGITLRGVILLYG